MSVKGWLLATPANRLPHSRGENRAQRRRRENQSARGPLNQREHQDSTDNRASPHGPERLEKATAYGARRAFMVLGQGPKASGTGCHQKLLGVSAYLNILTK